MAEIRHDAYCWACGVKRFNVIIPTELNGITVIKGTCPDCKKHMGLIPVRDWRRSTGDKGPMWD